MADKFYKQQQLSQTQLQQGAQTALSGVDNAANAKAAQADKSIEMLTNSVNTVVGTVAGVYQKNIDAKNRLESGREMASYQQRIKAELSNMPNLESLSKEELQFKVSEINSSFMEGYEDKPYRNQLKNDIEGLQGRVLGQMLTTRDDLHVKKVTDATAEKAAGLAAQYADGTLDYESLQQSLDMLIVDSMVAHQVPTSSELELPEEAREKYMSLTRQQGVDAMLKGIMLHTGEPNNSRLADLMDDSIFRQRLGVSDTDEDYNKMVAFAQSKGAKADKFKYDTDLDGFKNSLYQSTNIGIEVDIEKQVEQYKQNGFLLSPKDEHKLRKEFKRENSVILDSNDYVEKLKDGVDTMINRTPKEQQVVYNRAFTDTLGITDEGTSLVNITTALGRDIKQSEFKDYIHSGGKIPKSVTKLFDVPAGDSYDKWQNANVALMSMEAAAEGSGYAIESLIGVNTTAKVRGMARIMQDDNLDEAAKAIAIDALHTRSTSFNSKGYLQGTPETKVDTDWLQDVSKDAPWTTNDYVSSLQNAAEIEGNYEAFRLAGYNESTAKDKALELFKKSNINFEMPDGEEIIIPREHKYLNSESIIAFSKDVSRFPTIQEEREARQALTGEGWIADWRVDSSLRVQKRHNFAKTGKYDMVFNGAPVKGSGFTYEELEKFIADSPHEVRTKITGVKTERPFSEIEEEAEIQRKKNIKHKQRVQEQIEHVFNLKI